MTLPTGTISLSQVNTELEVSPSSTTINMGSSPVRGLADVPSGAIGMSDLQGKSNAQYIQATGGTISTVGDYKVHTFTSSGTFTVQAVGNPAGSDSVDYFVIAGGGGGGAGGNLRGAGGGAGGYRESNPSPGSDWTGSPISNPGGALPVSAQGYPITVGGGGGGNAGANSGTGSNSSGSASSFSTIPSAGGGRAGAVSPFNGAPGGSGGGGCAGGRPGGSGNDPSVSPPQGNNGVTGNPI